MLGKASMYANRFFFEDKDSLLNFFISPQSGGGEDNSRVKDKAERVGIAVLFAQ